jgi:hypothetical protein
MSWGSSSFFKSTVAKSTAKRAVSESTGPPHAVGNTTVGAKRAAESKEESRGCCTEEGLQRRKQGAGMRRGV